MPRIFAGYCQLCRAREIEQYNDLVGNVEKGKDVDLRHIQACEEAGCLHPAYYTIQETKDERLS